MSLPLAARTTGEDIPAALGTLRADPSRTETWSNRLAAHGVHRVGLAWSGNPGHRRDHERSLPLSSLAPMIRVMRERLGPELEFLSLQNHIRTADLEAWASIDGLCHFGEALVDFDDTAAVAQLFDLVICVDTAAAHLAASLGRPTWLLLPYVPDWRWQLEREDSPWYRELRLFRQRALGDWPSVLQRVQAAALEWCAARGANS